MTLVMRMINFILNGESISVASAGRSSLLRTLRDECRITSLKDGCSPEGTCGCCVALIDGHPRATCVIPTAVIAGRTIVTLEGLSDRERTSISQAFTCANALQCGFCIPGIAMRSKALADRRVRLSRKEIARALSPHLCRCTGYVKIIDAVQMLLDTRRKKSCSSCNGEQEGEAVHRIHAREYVLGSQPYVDDIELPDMLHAAVLFSPYPRAILRRVDTTAARSMVGVRSVITARDVPGQRWYGLLESDWPAFVAEGEEVRCIGDVIAAAAAIDRKTARDALKLVEMDFETLDPILDPKTAIDPRTPRVNLRHPNMLSRSTIRVGDVDSALSSSAHVVSGIWKTQRVEHCFLEPESSIAEPRPNGDLRVLSQGQGIFDDRRQIAALLGTELDTVIVELVPNGGAFGGKEDLSIQGHAALLAHVTGVPVKLTLSRAESIRMHPKRHPMTMEYSAACDAEGRLTAVRARILGDSGAYASVGAKVLERAASHACGPYRVPNVDVEAIAAYTNNPPSGAMRGFGTNQVHFAMEGCIDLLARKVGIDPWEFRWRNALEIGDYLPTGQRLEKSVGLKKTLLAVRDAFYAARQRGSAVGIACGIKNTGIGNGTSEHALVELHVELDGSILLYTGYTEMGQGLFTVLSQLAAQVTGLPFSSFRPRATTMQAVDSGQTTASRATFLGGRATLQAAAQLSADLRRGMSLGDLAGRSYVGHATVADTAPPESDVPNRKVHSTFSYATQLCALDQNGRVARFTAAHDLGRPINAAFCEGQIEGSIHMGLGYALTEELPCPEGIPSFLNIRDLGILRAQDMPEIDVLLIEDPEPEGPLGAKGVGEIGLVPTAAAVAGALEAYDGVRRFALPMRDSAAARVLSAFRRSRGKRRSVKRNGEKP